MGAQLDQARVRELVDVLAHRAVDPPQAMPPLVITYLRVARWLGTPPARPSSAYARALFAIEAHSELLPRALEGLDAQTARIVVQDAVTFIPAEHAPVLADELANRQLVPAPRIAAQLARKDLPRCLALLARLDRAPDARVAYVRALSAAYLASKPPAPELTTLWRELDARRAPASWAAALAAARLEIIAVEDPANALARLVSTLEEHGATQLGRAPARVVAAAIQFDRTGVLALAEDGWPTHRAIMAEAIAMAEPRAPELPELVDQILASWQRDDGVDRTAAGTIELELPLLATTILTRDQARSRAVVAATQPSRFMLRAATWAPMRTVNLADQTWLPELWDQLAAATHREDEAAIPKLGETEYAAWWKLETLPRAELPWFDARPIT